MRATSGHMATLLLMSMLVVSCARPREPDALAVGDGPAFLVGTRVWDDVSTTSYFHVVSSIEEGAEVDSATALEVPGAAKLFAVPGVGWFGIGDAEAPTLTRYTIDEDGKLRSGDRISLQPFGVTSLWDTLYVVSATKAYYPDRDHQQLVVWNPTEMIVTGTIALPETAREGFLSLYGYAPVQRGSELLITVAWFDWSTNDTVVDAIGLVHVDTESDVVTGFDVDPRCGGVTTPVTLASGDTMLVSSALAGAAHRLGRLSTSPCALRIRADATTFDPEFARDLGALTGGAVAGEPVPAGDGALFLRVLDDALATTAEGSATWELTGQKAWRWVRWHTADDALEPLDLEPSTADVLWFEVDGRVFGTETQPDYASTTLLELNAKGGPRRALTAPGFLHGVARVR